MAFNDHTDWKWDERVLRKLTSLDRAFGLLCNQLAACLRPFDGYANRYSSALAKVDAGQRRCYDYTWISGPNPGDGFSSAPICCIIADLTG